MLTNDLSFGLCSDVGEYLRDEVSPFSKSSTSLSLYRCGGVGNWETGLTDVSFVTLVGNPVLAGAIEWTLPFGFLPHILGIK